MFRALRFDRLVAWLWSALNGDKYEEIYAGSDDDSPHLQRFTLGRLRKMFARNGLVLLEACGTSFASGLFVLHLFGRFDGFVLLNSAIADHLPLPLFRAGCFAAGAIASSACLAVVDRASRQRGWSMPSAQFDGCIQKRQAKKSKQVRSPGNGHDSVHRAHSYGQNKGRIKPENSPFGKNKTPRRQQQDRCHEENNCRLSRQDPYHRHRPALYYAPQFTSKDCLIFC